MIGFKDNGFHITDSNKEVLRTKNVWVCTGYEIFRLKYKNKTIEKTEKANGLKTLQKPSYIIENSFPIYKQNRISPM